MRRRRRFLPVLCAGFLMIGTAQVAGMVDLSPAHAAAPAGDDLLSGCSDIPEAVALAKLLSDRQAGIARYQRELDNKRAEIALAESTLTSRLRQLKAIQDATAGKRQAVRSDVGEDIDRLVGVYAAMKPREAAAVLANLPPDFAAEILMRVEPEGGAAILAAVDPAQAAVLTTHMGARRVRHN